ncbi:MAG: TetR/AcrR family transcriptional regulator [Rhodospirillales bacterium]|nr:TetR/AcrR family transcriptional regulator [Rhodospirillales bacterium]
MERAAAESVPGKGESVVPAKGKREQILDAAAREFQEQGFAGTSMDAVACRAQVFKRTVYNHFESKEALFRAILQVMAEQVGSALSIRYRPGEPVETQLRALGWAEGSLLINPCFFRNARMSICEALRDPALAAEMHCKFQQMTVFEDFMAAAHAGGALKAPDPALAAQQFLGLIKARGFWPSIFSGEPVSGAEMERIVEDAVAMFLNTYRADKKGRTERRG